MTQSEINLRHFGALVTGPDSFLDYADQHEPWFPLVAFYAVMLWHEEYGRFLAEGDWIHRDGHRRPGAPRRREARLSA